MQIDDNFKAIEGKIVAECRPLVIDGKAESLVVVFTDGSSLDLGFHPEHGWAVLNLTKL